MVYVFVGLIITIVLILIGVKLIVELAAQIINRVIELHHKAKKELTTEVKESA